VQVGQRSKCLDTAKVVMMMMMMEEEEEDDYDVSNFGTQPFIPLSMFVLWGEERGRVIEFPVFFMNSSYDMMHEVIPGIL